MNERRVIVLDHFVSLFATGRTLQTEVVTRALQQLMEDNPELCVLVANHQQYNEPNIVELIAKLQTYDVIEPKPPHVRPDSETWKKRKKGRRG